MKELKVAAALGADALSLPVALAVAAGWLEPSSADMAVFAHIWQGKVSGQRERARGGIPTQTTQAS